MVWLIVFLGWYFGSNGDVFGVEVGVYVFIDGCLLLIVAVGGDIFRLLRVMVLCDGDFGNNSLGLGNYIF